LGRRRPVSALTINDNVVFVNILPRTARRKSLVSVSLCRLLSPRQSRHHHAAGHWTQAFHQPRTGSMVITLWGNMPSMTPANEALALEDPAEFAAGLFRQLLEKRGIVIYGKQRTRHTELPPFPHSA